MRLNQNTKVVAGQLNSELKLSIKLCEAKGLRGAADSGDIHVTYSLLHQQPLSHFLIVQNLLFDNVIIKYQLLLL